jgi:signal transduction histidine kinase/CheY-like chemotaxis protein
MRANDGLRDVRILVVDDDKDTRDMLRFILQQEGGLVVAAGSVAEAFESYKNSAPDVIVSDIGMPDYNGYALIALIRAHDKKLGRSTPVIAFTSYTSPADKEMALAASFQKYMSKPFNPAEIIEEIRGICSIETRGQSGDASRVNIAAIIREHHDEIIGLWTEEARRSASARGLTKLQFENLMPHFLSELAASDTDLGQLSGRQRDLIENHLSTRLRQGFDLAEIVDEIAILGRVVSRIWETASIEQRPAALDIQRFFGELNAASTLVADMFREHMVKDEQTEKRYARLLQLVASEALGTGEPFQNRIKEVLELIMEAMDAQVAVLLLCDSDERTLLTAASAGIANGVLEEYATTLDPLSFAGQVATHEEPTAVLDVVTTELQVNDALARNGIHSLLGVRLPPRHRLMGVLYIGLSSTRAFSPREIRRIETLADQLALHLDNAKLYADVQDKVNALTLERGLRERFMSVLVHDLRGPLTVAKMGSAMLVHQPTVLNERPELAAKIDTNIDRVERMIRDLLDTNRIRANERLPLHLAEVDLASIAREVIGELSPMNYGRFVLKLEDGVRGIWDPEELRRALWNLAINAVKYGAADKPITITVKRSGSEAQISVHNFGSVITPEDQASIFDSFARTQDARAKGQIGWGLGLTLVRGCSEAHGGKVTVESSAAVGTTFTIHLPPDSRPYQAGVNLAA